MRTMGGEEGQFAGWLLEALREGMETIWMNQSRPIRQSYRTYTEPEL